MTKAAYPKELVVHEGAYFHQADEAAFFTWLQSIECVGEVWGQVRDLHVPITKRPNDDELQSLVALFRRYHLDLSQVSQFETKLNARWFPKFLQNAKDRPPASSGPFDPSPPTLGA